jgi:hypothetical protein
MPIEFNSLEKGTGTISHPDNGNAYRILHTRSTFLDFPSGPCKKRSSLQEQKGAPGFHILPEAI